MFPSQLQTLIGVAGQEVKKLQHNLQQARARLEQQQRLKSRLQATAEAEIRQTGDGALQGELYAWLRGRFEKQLAQLDSEIAQSGRQVEAIVEQLRGALGEMKRYQRVLTERLRQDERERLKREALAQQERNLHGYGYHKR